GFRILADGAAVRYDAEHGEKGWHATRVVRIEAEAGVEVTVRPINRSSRSPRRWCPRLPGRLCAMLWIGLIAGLIAAAGVLVPWSVYRSRRQSARARSAERRAAAAERMAEVGSMTAGLAHEIKNPLSTIGLNAQLLAEGIEELEIDEEAKGRLSRRIGSLRREVERLRGILSDFLQFAG